MNSSNVAYKANVGKWGNRGPNLDRSEEEGGVLQIASGKFFGDGERWEFEAKGILYSNMSWVGTIETRAGTLEPVDTAGSEAFSYVLSYVNRMEKDAAGPIVRVGDEEIVEQFGWLGIV